MDVQLSLSFGKTTKSKQALWERFDREQRQAAMEMLSQMIVRAALAIENEDMNVEKDDD